VTADFVMAREAIAMAQRQEGLLEAAVCEHARLVYRIAFSVLRQAADAEDAAQETFLRALRYGGRHGGLHWEKTARIEDQKAWLARIAWRVAVERRRQVRLADARTETRTDESEDELVSPGHGAEMSLLEKERGEFLQQLIATLPGRLRDPLVLSTLEELSPREVGAMLGISEAAVRSRAFRARQILKERLATRMGAEK